MHWRFLCTTIALIARLLMIPVLGIRLPYQLFFLAVVVSAYFGGSGTWHRFRAARGHRSTLLLRATRYRLFPIEGADHQLGFAVYLFVAAILIVVIEMQHRAKRRAQQESAARQRAEEEERNHRQRFEITLASIGDGVIATDCEGRITFLNPSCGRTDRVAGKRSPRPAD